MRELLACLLVALASFQLAAAVPSSSDNKVVRMKRNYEEPIDLQFHNPDETNLVRIKRHRRSADEQSLVRVMQDEDELQRYKRQRRDVEDELHRFKRQKRDADDELHRFKRQKRDADDELHRFKRQKRDTHDELRRFTRQKRDTENELHRFKRQKRDAEDELERFKRVDPEPELKRTKRNKREAEASPALTKEKKEVREKKGRAVANHRKTPKVLKREKKTNINHHWQKHEKRGGNKHHIGQRLKKNVLRNNHRSDLLANHALRNVHLLSKRNKLGSRLAKHRVKRTQIKGHLPHPYNKLEADVAKLGRLRRDIALNLHKANLKNAAKRRVKRVHLKNQKKSSLKKH